ncbi:MAG: response regulator transcription factor [Cyanobacteria bacterium P01_H01_bin.15]
MFQPLRIVIIEDHSLTRISLRSLLNQEPDFRVVGEAATANEGLALVQRLQPDLVMVDIGLPDMTGIELTKHLRDACPDVDLKIVVLTLQSEEETVLAAFAAGADSYCMKETTGEWLTVALRATHDGQNWIDPAVAKVVLNHLSPSGVLQALETEDTVSIQRANPEYNQILAASPLTDRELEVLQLIVDGHSNSGIADELYITVGTVKTHVRNILNKLCAEDRTQAAVRALRSGLIA